MKLLLLSKISLKSISPPPSYVKNLVFFQLSYYSNLPDLLYFDTFFNLFPSPNIPTLLSIPYLRVHDYFSVFIKVEEHILLTNLVVGWLARYSLILNQLITHSLTHPPIKHSINCALTSLKALESSN